MRRSARYLNSDSGSSHAPARTAESFWQALINA
jgi:hypothetical protein